MRVEVIEPLRALRRRLKTIAEADIQRLRDRIQAVEIEAEEAAQLRLADIAGAPLTAEPKFGRCRGQSRLLSRPGKDRQRVRCDHLR